MLQCFLVFSIALFVRILPLLSLPHHGCDAYYFLLCVEEFKKNREIPIVLPPYYLLEQREQWYPPGFVIFLSLWPQKFLSRYYWILSPMVDSFIAVLVYVFAYLLTGDDYKAFFAGILYSLSLNSITETHNLTSRQLGALFYFLSTAGMVWFTLFGGYGWLFLFFLAGLALLFTHKLGSQALYFTCVFTSIVNLTFLPLFLLAMLVVIAVSISKGFFLKILKAQFDIISFWNRNWTLLGAHQIKHSPVYGNPALYRNKLYHLPNLLKHMSKRVFAGIAPLAGILVCISQGSILENLTERNLFSMVSASYLLFFITTLIPKLRLFGEGYKYLKYADIWGSILFLMVSKSLILKWAVLCLYFFEYLVYLFKVRRWNLLGTAGYIDQEFKALVDYLKSKSKRGRVLIIPLHHADALAYLTRWSVMWGTHNYSFKEIERILFPVVRKPLRDIVLEYNVDYLIVNLEYSGENLLEKLINEEGFRVDKKFGKWVVLAISA